MFFGAELPVAQPTTAMLASSSRLRSLAAARPAAADSRRRGNAKNNSVAKARPPVAVPSGNGEAGSCATAAVVWTLRTAVCAVPPDTVTVAGDKLQTGG